MRVEMEVDVGQGGEGMEEEEGEAVEEAAEMVEVEVGEEGTRSSICCDWGLLFSRRVTK